MKRYNDFNINKVENVYFYKMDFESVNMLIKNFKKNIFYISMYSEIQIKDNDLIIIYVLKRNKSNSICGGIKMILKVNKLELNNKKIEIFKDINLNKYISKISSLVIFNKLIVLSRVRLIFKELNDKFISLNIHTSINSVIKYKNFNLEVINRIILFSKKYDSIGFIIPVLIRPCKNYIEKIEHFKKCKDCIKSKNIYDYEFKYKGIVDEKKFITLIKCYENKKICCVENRNTKIKTLIKSPYLDIKNKYYNVFFIF